MPMPDADSLPVHLVDDDHTVADACRYLLEGLGRAVTYWSSGHDFLQRASLSEPAVLILDMKMPDLDGSQVHAALRERESCFGVIILTGHGDVDMAVEQMKIGAIDFLQKPVAAEALAEALKAASLRALALCARHRLEQRAAQLTEREREIGNLICQGKTNREIADALRIAVRTVEVHRSKVLDKLGASNTAEFAVLWQRLQ